MCRHCGITLNVEKVNKELAEAGGRFTIIEDGDNYILFDTVLQEDAFESRDCAVFLQFIHKAVFEEQPEQHYHIHND